MKTEIVVVDPHLAGPDLDRLLMPAAKALRDGQLVAFPTETVYGLGADALNPDAVARIFAAKGRPGDNPLIVHVARVEDIVRLTTSVPPLAVSLLDAFAPGPLTIILPRSSVVPDNVTAGLDTVAVRIPAHPVARRLIELAGVPVAAPSANRSGRPSPTRAWHVADDLDGVIPYIIDGGACEFGLESTVLDLTGPAPQILRPGAITAEAIQQVIDQVNPISGRNEVSGSGDKNGAQIGQDPSKTREEAVVTVTGSAGGTSIQLASDVASAGLNQSAPRSPGMKYRHYAPKARLLVCDQPDCALRAAWIGQTITALGSDRSLKIGLYLCQATFDQLPVNIRSGGIVHDLSVQTYAENPLPRQASHHLFDALRSFDREAVDLIIAEGLPVSGAGAAYMNRLRKAAGGGEPV